MPGTLEGLLVQTRGRWGRRQVIMPLTSRATHVLQWIIQTDAKPRGHAKLKKLFLVRIAV